MWCSMTETSPNFPIGLEDEFENLIDRTWHLFITLTYQQPEIGDAAYSLVLSSRAMWQSKDLEAMTARTVLLEIGRAHV